jgi:hypothetical protein
MSWVFVAEAFRCAHPHLVRKLPDMRAGRWLFFLEISMCGLCILWVTASNMVITSDGGAWLSQTPGQWEESSERAGKTPLYAHLSRALTRYRGVEPAARTGKLALGVE